MKKILSIFICLLGTTVFAKTKEVCGKRIGTAGNAALMGSNGQEVIVLAVPGEGTALLEQADKLIGKKSGVRGERGTQNGQRYCLTVELDAEGAPVKIIKARHRPK